jgi:hypothetical protein
VTTTLPAGPYRTLTTPEGVAFPYYIMPFDANGVCTGPQTRAHLLANLAGVTDIFVFSHGWNNDWSAATERYEAFIKGFQHTRATLNLRMPATYKPLLIGVFWPSQSLTVFENETGPGFAGRAPTTGGAKSTELRALIDTVAEELPEASRARFRTLASAASLDAAESRELATMLAAALGSISDDDTGATTSPSADDLLTAASTLTAPEPDYDAVGSVGSGPAANAARDPQAAGLIGTVLGALDPRNIIKPFTVWKMKDRAGVIGANGVAPLLTDVLNAAAPTARVHLLGHSYGCKVVMTATCKMTSTRQIESALLIQPAFSVYAFAETVPERNVSGGFLPARSRVRQPITMTFSRFDVPLHTMFHLSVRRREDVGELQYAGAEVPSKFAAMGGYGPQATQGATVIPLRNPGAPYTLPAAPAIIGIEGSRVIKGHGDFLHDDVWYLSWTLATAHERT